MVILDIIRKIKLFNDYENEQLTEEFKDRVQAIKERNSKAVWDCYYIPKAMVKVLKEDNYFGISPKVENYATAEMFKDMAEGKLDEFYRFVG